MGNAVKWFFKVIWAALVLCFGAGVLVGAGEKEKGWVAGHTPYGFYERHVKRPMDFGLSLFAVIVLWPVMLVVGLLVRLKIGKPVLFQQERPGLGGNVFTIKKFRTMLDCYGDDGIQIPDAQRLTDFGRKLRSTSLDELPELFNIIRGDMSIIGPRPLLVAYLSRYNEYQSHRHDVRPGLTGLAQVSGRNELSWGEKFEYDLKYVGKITFLGDLWILAQTVKTVYRKEGVSSRMSATMEDFTGNKLDENFENAIFYDR